MDRDELVKVMEPFDESLHELIEELLYEYFTGDEQDVSVAAMAARRRRLMEEKESLKERKQAIQDSITEAETELEVLDSVAQEVNQDQLIENALDDLAELSEEYRDPSNDAIENKAEKVGLNPQRFLDLLNEKYPVDQFGEPIVD